MKTLIILVQTLFVFALLMNSASGLTTSSELIDLEKEKPKDTITKKEKPLRSMIDYDSFFIMTKEFATIREQRLIGVDSFLEFSNDSKTLILDTRSKWAYDAKHLKGAIHLNFSDFTLSKLRKLIPDTQTRVLIYCNNNFLGDERYFALKSVPLALNIPTFINLYGYGYTNVFELADLLSVDDERIVFEGTSVSELKESKFADELIDVEMHQKAMMSGSHIKGLRLKLEDMDTAVEK